MKQATVNHPHPSRAAARLLLAALALACLLAPEASAQKKFSRDYPAQPNIRLHLPNRSGRIEGVAWEDGKPCKACECKMKLARKK